MNKPPKRIEDICNASQGRSQLFLPGSQGYINSIRHYYETSAEIASYAVEPGSAEDLSEIMKFIQANKDVTFAVKGGGHTSNPGFSSTTGMQISLSRLNKISFDEDKQELTVGSGCLFDEIYRYIRPKNYNIVGGGGSVGIGGWMMGGGYSLKTNQYGLGIDNLLQAEIVLPDGEIKQVNEKMNTDLFWAIRGGANNFGIATQFVLKTHKQGKVYGGLLAFEKTRVEHVKRAIIRFVENPDPKAAIVTAFRFYRDHGLQEFKLTVLAFYDQERPKPEADPFKDFLAIPHDGDLAESGTFDTTQPEAISVSPYTNFDNALALLYEHIPAHVATSLHNNTRRAFGGTSLHVNKSLAAASAEQTDVFVPVSFRPPEIAALSVRNARAYWGNVMVSTYTLNLINVIEEEGKTAKRLMAAHKGKMVVVDIWPFVPTMFKNSSDSAWPHKEANGPLLLYFMWEGIENDGVWINQMKAALHHIHQIALEEKCTTDDAPVYCNTALSAIATSAEIYRKNLADLRALRSKYDPHEVMKRTGGFRIPSYPAFVEGRYTITNAKSPGTIGSRTIPGPIIHGRAIHTIFQISSRVHSADSEYIISVHLPIYSTTVEIENIVYCKEQEAASTWKLVPESRTDGQLEYSIREGSKRWVLRGDQVKVEETNDREAVWRFNRLN